MADYIKKNFKPTDQEHNALYGASVQIDGHDFYKGQFGRIANKHEDDNKEIVYGVLIQSKWNQENPLIIRFFKREEFVVGEWA